MSVRLKLEALAAGAIVRSFRVVARLVARFVPFALVDVLGALRPGESGRTGARVRGGAAATVAAG